jgi:hypothetical protein
MKDFVHKIDNNPTSAGVVTADEYNSFLTELKNAIKVYEHLDEADEHQLSTSMFIASRNTFYHATGTENDIILNRSGTSIKDSSLIDRLTVFFQATKNNTGRTTIKLEQSPAFPARFKGNDMPPNGFEAGDKYIAVFDMTKREWDCDVIAVGGKFYPKGETHDVARKYGAPTGSIIALAGLAPNDDVLTRELKENYVFCDGSILGADRFPELYRVIGTTYGEAGETTPVLFLLPDLRGMFLRGLDDGTNRDSGRVIGTYQGSANLRHNHARTDNGFKTISQEPSGDGHVDYHSSVRHGKDLDYWSQNTGFEGAHEARPINSAVKYFIKFT